MFLEVGAYCMSPNPLIDILEANRLLRSTDEVTRFEQTLEALAQSPDPLDLPRLHLVLDDACAQPEVMFSLVHFLESFDVEAQVQAFVQVMPDLAGRSAQWSAILRDRIMNDAIAQGVFEERVRSIEGQRRETAGVLGRSVSPATKIA
jgi:Immunity protein 30